MSFSRNHEYSTTGQRFHTNGHVRPQKYTALQNSKVAFMFGSCFLIIGLSTFFTGCNSNVTSICPNYYIFNGYIYKNKVVQTLCSRCVRKDGERSCHRTTYTCYNAYIYASEHNMYDPKNSTKISGLTCKIKVGRNLDTPQYAAEIANSYDFGTKIHRYKERNTLAQKCRNSSTVTTNWWVGIVFLSLTPLMFLFGLCKNMQYKYENAISAETTTL